MITLNPNINYHFDFYHIFRQDTHNYDEQDFLSEILEWEILLSDVLHFPPAYNIRIVKFSSRGEQYLMKTGREKNNRLIGHLIVNNNFLKYHINPDVFHSVIAHEVIHSLVGCFNHKQEFKRVGNTLMNIVKGVKISRTICDPGYSKWHREKKEARQYKWKAVCDNCGASVQQYRKSHFIDHPEVYRCACCKIGKFKIYEIMPDGTEVKTIKIAV